MYPVIFSFIVQLVYRFFLSCSILFLEWLTYFVKFRLGFATKGIFSYNFTDFLQIWLHFCFYKPIIQVILIFIYFSLGGIFHERCQKHYLVCSSQLPGPHYPDHLCIIGAILGLYLGDKASILKPIGQIFLNLLFCLIVPLIFFSIAGSIANTKDTGKVGKMIGYTLLIFITTAIISGALILIVTHFTGVPTTFNAPKATQTAMKTVSISDQIVNTLTVGDLPLLISRFHVLPLIILTIFFGICVSMIGEPAKPVVEWMNAMSLVCYKMVAILMKAAPIGLGAYFADLTGTYGIDLLKAYGNAMLVFYSVVILYFFLFLGLYAYIGAGSWGVKNFFKVILAPALTALGTRSSAATIPLQMEACDKLGVPREISWWW